MLIKRQSDKQIRLTFLCIIKNRLISFYHLLHKHFKEQKVIKIQGPTIHLFIFL